MSRSTTGRNAIACRGAARWSFLAAIVLLSVIALWLSRAPLPPHLAPPRVVAKAPPKVAVWLTTNDRRLRLQREPDLLPDPPPGADARPDIAIDTTRTFQTITGFGAALTDASAWLIHQRLDAAQRQVLLDDLFGPPPGLGLDILRVTIGASDFSKTQYTLDDMPKGKTDPDLQHFSFAPELVDVVPTLHAIRAVNPHLRIFASPWSAPPWMKSPDQFAGGMLYAMYEKVFAQYLLRVVDAYAAQGLPLWAITIQNEPSYRPWDYPGMLVDPVARARIIGRYLGPELAKRQPRTLILGWDHNWDQPGQPLKVLGNAAARPYIGGIAWHCYGGEPSAQSEVHDAYPDKGAWLTECSGGGWMQHGELLWLARKVLTGSLRNWARGVVYWNLALDEKHGPHSGGCGNCSGLVTIDAKTGAVSRTDEYYAFAHFSRFVLPGAQRVWSNATGGGLDNVAFRNAHDGTLVLVAVNSSQWARAISVVQDAMAFHYTMPAESVATFVWQPRAVRSARPVTKVKP